MRAELETKKSNFRKDAYIYVEGDEDVDDVYIVEKGAVELTTANEQIKRYKPVVTDGEVFGFISALCRRPRLESAIARKDSVIIAVPRNRFIFLVQKNPEIALKIIRFFAEELRLYDEMMFSLAGKSERYVPEEMDFFNQGEYYYKAGERAYAHYIMSRYLQLHGDGLMAEKARAMLNQIESGGYRPGVGPKKDGIYKVFGNKEMIFCENEPGEELYIIKEGKVKIVKINNNNEMLLSVLREGDIFGELAIVSDKTRNAAAISWGTTYLLPIRKENLTWVLAKSPAIINKIFTTISQRIWFTYIMLEAKLYKKPITRLYSFMENKLMEADISLHGTQPVTLNYGIEDLIRLCDIPQSKRNAMVESLTEDTNIEFNFGQLLIKNPSVLASRAKSYKSRDHIKSGEEEEESSRRQKAPVEHQPFGDEVEATGSELSEALYPETPSDAPVRNPAVREPAPETGIQAPAAQPEEPLPDDMKLPSQEIMLDLD